MRGGRSELAPELMSLVTSWIQWYRPLEGEEENLENKTKKVTFATRVLFRAVEHANKGRSCKDRSVGRINNSWKTTENDKVEKQRWCDMVDTPEGEGNSMTIDPEGEAYSKENKPENVLKEDGRKRKEEKQSQHKTATRRRKAEVRSGDPS